MNFDEHHIDSFDDYLKHIYYPRIGVRIRSNNNKIGSTTNTIKLDNNDPLVINYNNMLLYFRKQYQTTLKRLDPDFSYIQQSATDMDDIYERLNEACRQIQYTIRLINTENKKYQRFVKQSKSSYDKKFKQQHNHNMEAPFKCMKRKLYMFYDDDNDNQYQYILQQILMQYSIKGIDYATGYDHYELVENLKFAITMSHVCRDFRHAVNTCQKYWVTKKTTKYSIGKMFASSQNDIAKAGKEILIRSELANNNRCSFCKSRLAEDSIFTPKKCVSMVAYISWKFCGYCEYELLVNHSDVPAMHYLNLTNDYNSEPYIGNYLVNAEDNTKYYFFEDLLYYGVYLQKKK